MTEETSRESARDPQDLKRLLVFRERAGDVDGIAALYEPHAVTIQKIQTDPCRNGWAAPSALSYEENPFIGSANTTPLRPACAITLAAVEQAVKQVPLRSNAEPAEAQAASSPSPSQLRGEDASRYCPVCSQRLESHRCKLICNLCGYYMSCSDYV